MTPARPSGSSRPASGDRPLSALLVALLVLVGGAGPAAAATVGTDARIETLAYSGSGNVTGPDGETYLWRSGAHRFSATVSTTAGVDGRVCLVAVPAGNGTARELACEPATVPANGTATVDVAFDGWPANLTGSQTVRAVLTPSNSSTVLANRSVAVTVIRKGGDLDGDDLPNRREASLGTGLRTADSDGDGLADGEEVRTYGTSPVTVDTDGDDLSDRAELRTHQTNPEAADSDGDDLSDGRELAVGTNPNRADSDGDGVGDALEVNTHETGPTDPDTDDDGVDDGAEIRTYETNPSRADTDEDGLNDNLEIDTYGTDPNKVDSDGDGLADGVEVGDHQTDPAAVDSDGDGLADGQEANTYGTNPTNPDSDGDGLEDGPEVNRYGTNPTAADTDGDGRSDRAEVDDGLLSHPLLPAAVAAGLLGLGVAGGVLYRRDRPGVAALWRRLRPAVGADAPESGDDAGPAREEAGRAVESLATELLSNEEQVLRLLDAHDGPVRQSDIVEETDWSKSKVSRVLAEMEEDEQIVKVDVGRANVVARPDDLPSGARSPFDG